MGGAFASGARRGACMKAPARRGVNGARDFAERSVDESAREILARLLALLRAALIRAVHPTRPRLVKGPTPPMTANPPELVRSDEAASLWKSVLHAPSPRLATSTRDALLEHTRCLERTASELRVAIDARELEAWLRGGQLGALETALAALTDGASALALIPVDDVSALRADPSYTFASFVASPANSAVRARVLAFARDARARQRVGARDSRRHQLRQDSPAARAPGRRSPSRSARSGIVCASAEQLSLELIRALWGDAVDAVPRAAAVRLRADHRRRRLPGGPRRHAGRAGPGHRRAARARRAGGGLARQAHRAQLRACPSRCAPSSPDSRRSRSAPPEWETRVAIVHARARRWRVEPSAAGRGVPRQPAARPSRTSRRRCSPAS